MRTPGPTIARKPLRRLLGVPLFAALAVLPSAWTSGSSHTPPPAGTFQVPASIPSDCSHSVTTALNRWITKVPDGSTIQFPAAACYSLDATVVVSQHNNVIVDGGGSTFKRLTPSNESQSPPPPNSNNAMWRIDRGSNVTLRNLTIVGNYTPPPRGTPGQGQYTDHGVSIWGAQGASVLNADISDVDGEFVAVDPDVVDACARFGCDYSKASPSRNILVDNLTGTGASRQCVSSTDVDGLTISNSTLDNCQQTGFDAEIDVYGEVDRNIHFVDNTITNVYFAPISVPVLNPPGYEGNVGNIEIRGNNVPHHYDTCYADLYLGERSDTYATGITVAGNTMAGVGDGVTVSASSAMQVSISGNTLIYEGNGACNNPNFTPPYSVPVRANNLPGVIVDLTNTFIGF